MGGAMFKYGIVVGLFLTGPALCAEISSKTDLVHGHAPVITDVQVDNLNQPGVGKAKVNDVLEGRYTFNDVDGDVEQGTQLQWVREDSQGNFTAIEGATGNTYTVVKEDGGANLKLQVTGKTDPDITIPFSAPPVISAVGIFGDIPYLPANVFFAGNTAFSSSASTAGSAKSCNDKGGRMMSVVELQEAYLAMTSAETIPSVKNTEICGYGWTSLACKNGVYGEDLYWTSEQSGSIYKVVNMTTGAQSTMGAPGYALGVACKKI
jgi:hypothetical protein